MGIQHIGLPKARIPGVASEFQVIGRNPEP